MAKRFRDFGSGDSVVKEPLSFKLHGEEFNCVPMIQGKFLLDLVADSNSDDPVKNAETKVLSVLKVLWTTRKK